MKKLSRQHVTGTRPPQKAEETQATANRIGLPYLFTRNLQRCELWR